MKLLRFKLNRVDPYARTMKYIDVPLHYVWQKRQRIWKRRTNQSSVIPRLYFVLPRDLERYCLRLLLLRITGATGYGDLRNVNAVQHDTFRSPAVALGLLSTDNEWIRCLEEAATWQSPVQLRHLFVTILLLCNPASPGQLWSAMAVHLSEDYVYRSRQNNPDSEDSSLVEAAQLSALHRIGALLGERGSALQNFDDLPALAAGFVPVDLGIGDSELDVDHLRNEAHRNVRLLNAEQRRTFDAVTAAIESDAIRSRLFFVDGPGGTGKSFLFNTMIAYVKGIAVKEVLAVASSGVASLLLIGGRTAHSTFNVPIPI